MKPRRLVHVLLSLRTLVAGLPVVIATLGFAPARAQAYLIADYFNGFGAVSEPLSGNGAAGGGWAGGWTGGVTTTFPEYAANEQLTFANPAYNNRDNATGPTHGSAGAAVAAGAPNLNFRSFQTGLTGTIWISALTRLPADVPANSLMAFNGSINNFVGIRHGKQSEMRYNGVSDGDEFGAGADLNYLANTTYLYLVKIVIDASGTADTMSFWIKDAAANLSSEAALGTPSFTKTGTNVFGTALTSVGLSFAVDGGLTDQVRVSDEGLYAVLHAPEPASVALLASGLLLLWRRR